jgi:hypothetical protein
MTTLMLVTGRLIPSSERLLPTQKTASYTTQNKHSRGITMPSEEFEPAISDSKILQSTSYIVRGLAGTYSHKIKYFLICTSGHRRKEVILQQDIWIKKL